MLEDASSIVAALLATQKYKSLEVWIKLWGNEGLYDPGSRPPSVPTRPLQDYGDAVNLRSLNLEFCGCILKAEDLRLNNIVATIAVITGITTIIIIIIVIIIFIVAKRAGSSSKGMRKLNLSIRPRPGSDPVCIIEAGTKVVPGVGQVHPV
ncbi:hypothetical protein AK812_SmicGene23970 [Symbiodinium microadriaticum]|uniref:Uncharacterized protein n=1 Tax=Symbiodinium microadriaticum TaxID=2951 RepID=A0A1Q9DFV4_SYMMI|nr:hypothetical protein AK812_SmicGene23970 [Symbiodinium microadriaticum]